MLAAIWTFIIIVISYRPRYVHICVHFTITWWNARSLLLTMCRKSRDVASFKSQSSLSRMQRSIRSTSATEHPHSLLRTSVNVSGTTYNHIIHQFINTRCNQSVQQTVWYNLGFLHPPSHPHCVYVQCALYMLPNDTRLKQIWLIAWLAKHNSHQ